MVESAKKKKFKVPHTYVILFSVIIIMSILTYVIPAGEFDRVKDEATGRTLVSPDSFHNVEQNPIKPFALVQAVPRGMEDAAQIIFFIFIVGGAFQIITATGTIEAGIGRLAKRLNGKENLMIPIFMVIFGIGGATFGMAEETIVFVPIGIALARALGFDAITGTAMITLGAACGFNSGFMNPFSVGVAQGIAELPLFSGIIMRIIIFVVLLIITAIYIIRYAEKVKKDSSKSVVAELELEERGKIIDLNNVPTMRVHHNIILLTVIAGFAVIITGVFKFDWYILEIGSTFLAMGVISGLIGGLGPSKIAQEFVVGAKSIAFGALVVGVARGILIVMKDGLIIDSIVYGLAKAIQILPKSISVIGMYIVQVIINFFIPSGSGQAAATMPIMVPLSDLLGITRQTAVMAFQFGDGFTNSIIPTSAALMGYLSMGNIPYEKWFKFIWPLMLIWIGTGMAFLVIANAISYGPF
ncbi:TIGR00366 family protein [Tissierella carlieri]|uniref:TIGR00366 family protein n=1 Tax=Tissierella carlieri TaxID=689904 RepID=A0ABT1SBY8_9FIRM|nr:TIGR00366 family protein [Tissierella carlieri]MCQ4923872.1 TIGR00366 family protein [Tissierella carlieri]